MRGSPNWNKLDSHMQESLEMMAVKMSRILTGDFRLKDSWQDLVGYPKLVTDHRPKLGWTEDYAYALEDGPPPPSVAPPAAEATPLATSVPASACGPRMPAHLQASGMVAPPALFTSSLGQKLYEKTAEAHDPAWDTLTREEKREWEIAALPKPCTSADKPDSGRAGLSNATSEDK